MLDFLPRTGEIRDWTPLNPSVYDLAVEWTLNLIQSINQTVIKILLLKYTRKQEMGCRDIKEFPGDMMHYTKFCVDMLCRILLMQDEKQRSMCWEIASTAL